MFYLPMPLGKTIPEMANVEGFASKLDLAMKFLKIDDIFCQLENQDSIPKNWSILKLPVSEIAIQGAHISAVKPLLQDWLKLLDFELDSLLANCDSYSDIADSLQMNKRHCIAEKKVHDLKNPLMVTDEVRWQIYIENRWERSFFGNMNFTSGSWNDIQNHFDLRKNFYGELIELIDRKIVDHQDIPAFPRQPYKWNSDHPHREIAELAFALLSSRVKFVENEKGSYSKFVKQLYNLFGYDGSQYHSKLQDIRNAAKKNSWLHELPQIIETSIEKKKEVEKTKP